MKRALLALLLTATAVSADPCGMVPPIYTGAGSAITRVGPQKTYVFFKDGVESFVIRPGFRGKVDEFGMLIPFPTPPSIKKIDGRRVRARSPAAIDPPEVVVDLEARKRLRDDVPHGGQARDSALHGERLDASATYEVRQRPQREEAVGMYDVAVLEAGSAAALRSAGWRTHDYQVPRVGMEEVCEDYVEQPGGASWRSRHASVQKPGVTPFRRA